MTEIEYVRKCSQYLNILLRNNPAFEEWLLGEGNLKRKYPLTELYSALGREACKGAVLQRPAPDISPLQATSFFENRRKRLSPLCGLSETTGQLSDLASVALQVGLEVLSAHPDWWAWDEELDVWRRLGGRSRWLCWDWENWAAMSSTMYPTWT